jgi:hypothetical protein
MRRHFSHCPVCGSNIQIGSIPAVRKISFECSRCRAQLEVSAPDVTPIVAISGVLSLILCVIWGLRGQLFILAVVCLAAIFHMGARLVQTIVATPKLQKSQSKNKLPHLPKRILPSHFSRANLNRR